MAKDNRVLEKMDAYWRAANYLSVGQIYLMDNPLLRESLQQEHIKPRLLGHWGTTPGLNFIYVHFNRAIRERDLSVVYVAGPGHGGPGLVANTYLEGTYSEVYPDVSEDVEGMRKLFKQFSFPGGIPSHVAPETPGSIHEGGELGYAVVHAYGAAYDNPDLVVCCVVGDGEAETGPLAASWHSNKFLNPARDGAVLPILHLNGYKIANPTLLACMSDEELTHLFIGYGYQPLFVEGDEPMAMHRRMADTLDAALDEIRAIQERARSGGFSGRPRWPMIILRTPKGWTGPKVVDGHRVEGSYRSHQVPLAGTRENPEHMKQLEEWMRSYRPEELFDESGRLIPELRELAPRGERRMGANPHANGGVLLKDLRLPDFRDYAVDVPRPGQATGEATRVLGEFLRDVMRRNLDHRNFRVFGPDETASNRLGALFEVTDKVFTDEVDVSDEHISADGRVMEVLSEHLCQGWLEGYLLTGRHGFFSCYEAFIHIVDSMFNQHAKWLKVAREIPWRRPVASLNYLPGSRLHRPRRQQEGGHHPRLPASGREHVAVRRRRLPALAGLHQRDRGRQAASAPVSRHGGRDQALRGGDRDLGVGQQRPGRGAGCRDGLRRRRAHARDPGGRRDAPAALSGPEDSRRERGGSHDPAARDRAPPRPVGPRFRHDLHHRQADRVRVPRVSLADPPADLPPHQPPEPARAWLQGGRDDQHSLRHGRDERPGPLPPGSRRDRPGAEAGSDGGLRQAGDPGQANRAQALHRRARRGHAGDPRLDLE
jgi:transketolase N-terminal domain/subunit